MNIEDRLVAALRSSDDVEPSTDLWSRVVHSIEEDRIHRRRVLTAAAVTASTMLVLTIVGLLGLTDGPDGTYVRTAVMEAIETAVLVVLVAVLGPAIGRFGRGYTQDLWPAAREMATSLLRLLDVAYFLVFAGYILLSVDFGSSDRTLGSQLEAAGGRIGGLLLVMGVLHAATMMALPVVALISNATRRGRRLPRWLTVMLVIGGAWMALQGVGALIGGLIAIGGS
jgi:TRAP-type mannitol/chloroaromatic compound transport system permease small subunit